MENKKGWMKIVEAVIAIMLIASVLLIVISQGYLGKKDISSQFYDIEIQILREIQLNDELRSDVLNAGSSVEMDDEGFPLSVKERIESRVPDYIECAAKICEATASCELTDPPKKEVYAEAAAITTTLETDPENQLKQLKLFCWAK